MPPKVSVITVVYNNAETIEGAIVSVAEQMSTDIEHIVVDGGSTDGTMDVIEKYGEAGNWVVTSEPDRGIYDAMNQGFATRHRRYHRFPQRGRCLCGFIGG